MSVGAHSDLQSLLRIRVLSVFNPWLKTPASFETNRAVLFTK
jgi:hypothetical protein